MNEAQESSEGLLRKVELAQNDKELFDAVSEVVAIPKAEQTNFSDNSFIMHAPLELCARYYLLPLIDEDHISVSRDRIRDIARKYASFEDGPKQQTSRGSRDVTMWATSFSSAGHATILLTLIELLDDSNSSLNTVLASLNSKVISGNGGFMEWSHKDINKNSTKELDRSNIVTWFLGEVANINQIDADTNTIESTVKSAEKADLIDPLISVWLNQDFGSHDYLDSFFPVIMRIAAMSMLVEDESNSKYGWTHCLTIPHSHWVLARSYGNESKLFLTALTYLASYRATMGKTQMTGADFQDYFNENEDSVFATHYEEMLDIISNACVLEDAHLIKYVYTSFDIIKRDPHYAALYIAASKKLLDVWQNVEQ